MGFEWDERKASSNLSKHGVAFADAVGVFEDPNASTIEDERSAEARHLTLGMDFLGRILVVSYTWRGADRIRIISARAATPSERRIYAEGGS